jgi:hypothetical protein
MRQPVTAHHAGQHRRDSPAAGVAGNEKLTAMTGAVLLIGFAVEGATMLAIHRLIVLHFVVGLLLIGPVLLKIGSTLYRFIRYYSRAEPYVRKGPPSPILRVLGPLVILTSVAVLGTGVVLAIVGPGHGQWLFLHKAAFVLWFGVMTVHVLNYGPKLPRMLFARSADSSASVSPDSTASATAAVPGATARWLLLIGSLAVGVGIAAVTMHLSTSWGFGW